MREWIGKHKAEAFGAAALAVIAAVCIIRMIQPVKVWDFGEDQLERMGEAIHFDADVIDEMRRAGMWTTAWNMGKFSSRRRRWICRREATM